MLRLRQVRCRLQRNIRRINPLQKREEAGFSRGNQRSPILPNRCPQHAWARLSHLGQILIAERHDPGFIDRLLACLPILLRLFARYE